MDVRPQQISVEGSKQFCGQPPSLLLGVKIQDLHFGLFLCVYGGVRVHRRNKHCYDYGMFAYMRKFIQRAYFEIKKFSLMYKELEVSAHAAAASFYLFLSIIPLIALVLTIIPYTPIKQEQLNQFLSLILPASLESFIEATTLQMYGEGPIFLIISAVSLIWSAGKGMQSITRGLNAVYGVKNEKRNFILLRLEACVYTVLLVVILIIFVMVTFLARYVLTQIMNVFHVDLDFYISVLNNRYLFEWLFLAAFSVCCTDWFRTGKCFPTGCGPERFSPELRVRFSPWHFRIIWNIFTVFPCTGPWQRLSLPWYGFSSL